MKDSHSIAKGLVSVLLDETARVDERDDAAMDLYEFDYDYVIAALVQVARNPNVDSSILDTCGETLETIWTRNNNFDVDIYNSLTKESKFAVYLGIQESKPDWIDQYKLSWPPK